MLVNTICNSLFFIRYKVLINFFKCIYSVTHASHSILVWDVNREHNRCVVSSITCFFCQLGKPNKFTHWLLMDYIEYEKDDEVVEKDKIIVNDKEHTVSMIRKDGVTYIKTRDIANALNLEVSNKGKIPVLKAKNGW